MSEYHNCLEVLENKASTAEMDKWESDGVDPELLTRQGSSQTEITPAKTTTLKLGSTAVSSGSKR